MNKKRSIKKILICGVIAVSSILFFHWQNNVIRSLPIDYSSPKLPVAFDGFKILQISDLHNKVFGKNQTYLIEKIKDASPDIIVITGDLVDYYDTQEDTAIEFVNQAILIAPVYYAAGNHENKSGIYPSLSGRLRKAGVTVLDNEKIKLQKNGLAITLMGLLDISFIQEKANAETVQKFGQTLERMQDDSDGFTILLSHRPEYMNLYKQRQIDVVFAGHAHGGQVRLPLIGGLYAPGQGFFPKYTSGSYMEDATTMIVSQGLGSSIFPLRIFNQPQIITVTLHSQA